jgi:hypothetical protein
MMDPKHPLDATNAANSPLITGEGLMGQGGSLQWTDSSDQFWHDAFETRTYLPADSTYEQYRGAYRYGHEAAGKHGTREWVEVEAQLAPLWETYEHRGDGRADWQTVRAAVRDGWERARRALKI